MQSGFDISKLFQEAHSRWLKAPEVYSILENSEKHQLTLSSPQYPPSGSLFLFNRRVLRFFRKDGYKWRKKKDGRTVGEAHERLKVGNVDALNCYYAHGEDNPNFQRRCYWMLDPTRDHIVLVHYREITEGRLNNGSISQLSPDSRSIINQSIKCYSGQHLGSSSGTSELYEPYQSSFSPGSLEEVSSKFVGENSVMNHVDAMARSGDSNRSAHTEVNQALRRLTEQLSLGDEDNCIYLEKLPLDLIQNENQPDSRLLAHEDEQSKHEELVNLPLGLKCERHEHLSNGNSGMQGVTNNILILHNLGDVQKQQSQPFAPGCAVERKESLSWNEMLELSSPGINAQNRTSDRSAVTGVPSPANCMLEYEKEHHAKDTTFLGSGSLSSSERVNLNKATEPQKLIHHWKDFGEIDETNMMTNYDQTSEYNFNVQLSAAKQFLLGADDAIVSPTSNELLQGAEKSAPSTYSSETSILETSSGLEILGRTNSIDWVETRNMHIVKDTSDYYDVWFDEENRLQTPVQLDANITIAQKQRFSIREVSPEWAYSTEDTKLIITGDFLCDPSECALACMFGDTEVPVEVIQTGVLRCWAPQHAPGKVSLCITSGNRESCSEIREFEFCVKPKGAALDCDHNMPNREQNKSTEELLLLIRFAGMLLLGHDSSSVQRDDNVDSEIETSRKSRIVHDTWDQQLIEALLVGSETPPSIIVECVLQKLFEDKLHNWLLSRSCDGEAKESSLSKQEQGIIHLIAGLGYEWALDSILNAGVGVNFRDVNGWTALHWAAQFGREKMVVALLAAGASARAVTDPTPKDPVGKDPASIAEACGHKGLAGYLSEKALTSHLSSLTLEKNEISKESAAMEAERTMEKIADKSVQAHNFEDQISLKDSLAAVRNAALAAARIQSAFRAHSFRKRQHKAAESFDEYGMTANDIHGLLAASKFLSHRDHKLNKAALSIQKKYRGWKRRKEFLTLRQNVVKIQAHVRGHQIRKKYKEFLWTVGVLEKAVLRWRRKGIGLRGFRPGPEPIDENEDDDILKVYRKQKVYVPVDEAMSRVLSIVESPTARQQYRRLLESYRQAKAKLSINSDEAMSSQGNDDVENDVDENMYDFA